MKDTPCYTLVSYSAGGAEQSPHGEGQGTLRAQQRHCSREVMAVRSPALSRLLPPVAEPHGLTRPTLGAARVSGSLGLWPQ